MIGDYRHFVRVQTPTAAPDGDGGVIETWADVDPPWHVAITPATVRDLEREAGATIVATATHVIRGRYRDDVAVTDRIVWNPNSNGFPLDGIAAYWPLDEPEGTRVDRVGGANLTDHNGVGWAPGVLAGGAHFQQVNSQYLSAVSTPPLVTGDVDFTIAAWIKLASVSQCVIIGKDSANGRDYVLDVSPDGLARFAVSRGSTDAVIESLGPVMVAGTWYFVVAGYDATGQMLFVQVNDGPIDSAPTDGVTPNTSASEFRIGSRQKAPIAEFFDGVIDEVGLWKRLLLPAERTALYNGGAGLASPRFRVFRITGVANPNERNLELRLFAVETV